MSKNVKRALSLLISFALIFSVAALGSSGTAPLTQTSTASQSIKRAGNPIQNLSDAAVQIPASCRQTDVNSDGCDCEHNPFIVVPGITDSDVALLDAQGNPVLGPDGKPYIKGGFMVDEDAIIDTALKNLALPLAKTLVTQKDSGFTDAVYETAKSAFWRQATNKDGTPVENLEVIRYEKSFAELTEEEINHLFINIPLRDICDIIGYDHVYYFAFNIIGDPMETARELDQFIQMVKQQTGHDKVNILNASLGASIFTAYAEQFKDKGDVEKVVNIVALLNGSLILRDLYASNFDLSDEALYRDFFPAILADGDSKAMGYLVNLLIRVLPRQVLLDTFDAVLNGAMDSMLRHAPNFWAMIPREDYPALADKWLSGDEYAVMRAKSDAFYQAQLNLEDNMLYMINEKGAEINNVCGYNLKFSDMTNVLTMINSDKTINSDGVIHVQSTALGVTAAPAGQQLPADYLAAHAGSKYISPDKGLDASTCVLPDNTWFFYDQDHEEAGKNAACMNLVGELFTNPNFIEC
jgi:pimeloyl-ACP methyl ester carboxylesterase